MPALANDKTRTRKSLCNEIMEFIQSKILAAPPVDDGVTTSMTPPINDEIVEEKPPKNFHKKIVHINSDDNKSSPDQKHSPVPITSVYTQSSFIVTQHSFFPAPKPKASPKERYNVDEYEDEELEREVVKNPELSELLGLEAEEKNERERKKLKPKLWAKVPKSERRMLIASNIMPSIGIGLNYTTGIVSKLTADVAMGGAGIALSGATMATITFGGIIAAALIGFAFYKLVTVPTIIAQGNLIHRIEKLTDKKAILERQIEHNQYKSFRTLVRMHLTLNELKTKFNEATDKNKKSSYKAATAKLEARIKTYIDFLVGDTKFEVEHRKIERTPTKTEKFGYACKLAKYRVLREITATPGESPKTPEERIKILNDMRIRIRERKKHEIIQDRKNRNKKINDLIQKISSTIKDTYSDPFSIKAKDLDNECISYQKEILSYFPKIKSKKIDIVKPRVWAPTIFAGVSSFMSSYGLSMGFLAMATGGLGAVGTFPPGLIILGISLIVGISISYASHTLRKKTIKRNEELERLKDDAEKYEKNKSDQERRNRKNIEYNSESIRTMRAIEIDPNYIVNRRNSGGSPDSPDSDPRLFRSPSTVKIATNSSDNIDRGLFQSFGLHMNPFKRIIGGN